MRITFIPSWYDIMGLDNGAFSDPIIIQQRDCITILQECDVELPTHYLVRNMCLWREADYALLHDDNGILFRNTGYLIVGF